MITRWRVDERLATAEAGGAAANGDDRRPPASMAWPFSTRVRQDRPASTPTTRPDAAPAAKDAARKRPALTLSPSRTAVRGPTRPRPLDHPSHAAASAMTSIIHGSGKPPGALRPANVPPQRQMTSRNRGPGVRRADGPPFGLTGLRRRDLRTRTPWPCLARPRHVRINPIRRTDPLRAEAVRDEIRAEAVGAKLVGAEAWQCEGLSAKGLGLRRAVSRWAACRCVALRPPPAPDDNAEGVVSCASRPSAPRGRRRPSRPART